MAILRKRSLIPGLVAAASVAAACQWFSRQEVTTNGGKEATTVNQEWTPWNLAYEPGKTYVYRLSYDTRGRLAPGIVFGAAGSPTRSSTTALSGELSMGFSGSSRKGGLDLQLRLSIDHLSSTVDGRDDAHLTASLKEALSRPIQASIAPGGLWKSVTLDSDMPATAELLLKALLSELQVIEPPAGSQHQPMIEEDELTWNVMTEDVYGRHTLVFTQRDACEASQCVVRRERKDCVGDDMSVRQECRGETVIELADGVPRSIRGKTHNDSFKLEAGNEELTATNAARFEAKLVALKEEAAVARDDSHTQDATNPPSTPRRTSDLSADSVQAHLEKKMQLEQLGEETLDSVVSAIRSARKDDAQKLLGLYLKLKALLFLDPESARTLVAEAEGAASDDPMFTLTVRALGSVGSAACQEGLMRMISSSNGGWNKQVPVMFQLGKLPLPTVETEEFVRGLSRMDADPRLQRMALLVLGSMGGHLKTSDPERSSRIHDELRSALLHAETEREQMLVLGALGNVGRPSSSGELREFLKAPSPKVRAKAAKALRFVPGDAAEQALIAAMADASEGVIKAALFASHFRKPTSQMVEAQTRLLRELKSEQVQTMIVRYLGKARVDHPAAADSLRWAVDHGAAQGVRDLARTVLGG